MKRKRGLSRVPPNAHTQCWYQSSQFHHWVCFADKSDSLPWFVLTLHEHSFYLLKLHREFILKTLVSLQFQNKVRRGVTLKGYFFLCLPTRAVPLCRSTVDSITRTFKGNRKTFELTGVRVIGSSKKIAQSKVKNRFYCTVNILITFNCINVTWKLRDTSRL